MSNLVNQYVDLSQKGIMDVFWEKVAGQTKVVTGNLEYIRPLNYATDKETVIVDPEMPILNLKNNNLPLFEKALTEYVSEYFNNELNWANPVTSCNSNSEKLIHAISTLWLNATTDDFENPIQFINRYTNFLKDKTFEEFLEQRKINKVQTLKNCSICIQKAEQEEFQETPTAIRFFAEKNGTVKNLPRIAYGISDKTAYIYGIQGYKEEEGERTPEIKQVNRSRYAVNKKEKIPVDYQNVFLKQEPYAYISLFMFLSMLKQKGINKVVMPSFLPSRYANKSGTMEEIRKKQEKNIKPGNDEIKQRKQVQKEYEQRATNLQRIQYNVTNKFLGYASRMECDVPGVTITAVPDETNGSLVMDISQMSPSQESNIIFYELYKKIEGLMKHKNRTEEER